jgi:hypothetical protein
MEALRPNGIPAEVATPAPLGLRELHAPAMIATARGETVWLSVAQG